MAYPQPMNTFYRRARSGSMASVAMIGMIPVMMAVGAFAIDVMHGNVVKGELLKACDAGALAGAWELDEWDGGAGQSAIEDYAKAVTALNLADGKLVADTTPNATVTATVTVPPPNLNGSDGVVRVEASMQTGNLWAQLFAQAAQTYSCSADATCYRVKRVNKGGAFPLAVVINKPGPAGTLLSKQVGDIFKLGWAPGQDNVLWNGLGAVGNSTSDVFDLIEDYGDGQEDTEVTAKDASTPGTMLNTTTQVQPSNIQELANFVDELLVLPVVSSGSNEIIGFVALEVQSVTVNGANSVVTGEIQENPVNGLENHLPASGNAAWDNWLRNNSVTKIRLVQ